ncbi:MAG: hypothetical protein A2Z34_10230 [Planctomycetes bacterium RBG_16_59_8]|nr:MAG: hypothetical protein A2Z34_10230 [Planctomycetes bacterium RBG_16_59_8]
MAQVDTLKEKIQKTKGEIGKVTGQEGKDGRAKLLESRKLRKSLKRHQRKLSRLTVLVPEDRAKRFQKLLDNVTAQQTTMQKDSKKRAGDANLRSFSKKIKTLNKRLKRVNKVLEKIKAATPPAEKPAEEKKA